MKKIVLSGQKNEAVEDKSNFVLDNFFQADGQGNTLTKYINRVTLIETWLKTASTLFLKCNANGKVLKLLNELPNIIIAQ